MHTCNEEDWSKFWKPGKASKNSVKGLIESNTMQCLNKVDRNGKPLDWNVFGMSDVEPHKRIDFMFTPCAPTINPNPKSGDVCTITNKNKSTYLKKLAESIKYIGNPKLRMVIN